MNLEDTLIIMRALHAVITDANPATTDIASVLERRIKDINRELHPKPLAKAIGYGKQLGW